MPQVGRTLGTPTYLVESKSLYFHISIQIFYTHTSTFMIYSGRMRWGWVSFAISSLLACRRTAAGTMQWWQTACFGDRRSNRDRQKGHTMAGVAESLPCFLQACKHCVTCKYHGCSTVVTLFQLERRRRQCLVIEVFFGSKCTECVTSFTQWPIATVNGYSTHTHTHIKTHTHTQRVWRKNPSHTH